MQAQNKAQIKYGSSPFVKLLIGWFIIIFSYIMIRIIFIVFGFVPASALGGCLAIIPYLFGALYFGKARTRQSGGFYTLGILLPSVVEKIFLYLMGAFLYDISPAKITGVLKAISAHEPYTNFLTQTSARYFFNISFFGWAYILSSIAVSVLLVFLLTNTQRRKR